KEKVEAVAEKLEIKELLEKFPTECSGGQCQRIAIARALVTNPKLIVADEPTGNLDSKNSHDVLTILKDLNEKEGVTIVMVTHDPMIASYGKRLLYIRDGKIYETLEKKDMDQQDYFYKIVEINSKESTSFLNKK
ncbi:MAG: ATP-binding cassette domain-containing protein, partial [Erysipelotrichaceae bacterium]